LPLQVAFLLFHYDELKLCRSANSEEWSKTNRRKIEKKKEKSEDFEK